MQTINTYLKNICQQNNLQTYDPYDIWKTSLGIIVKKLFHTNKILGLFPAAFLTLFDLYVNNKFRFFYKKQEYPIVRAQAVSILLNIYKRQPKPEYLKQAKKHLQWLVYNSSKGYSGYCWGINFKWVSKNKVYLPNTPHATHTPYVLEAFIEYTKITNSDTYKETIQSVYHFLENDLIVMYQTTEQYAVSYSPEEEPLIVYNANAYAMYMYALFLEYFPDKTEYIKKKIKRIYNFIITNQNTDGSWTYYHNNDTVNFIDCFHSCFILKNIIKTNRIFELDNSSETVQKGYNYLLNSFFNKKTKLFTRFSLNDKPSIIKYDLYDNAEMLNVMMEIGANEKAIELKAAIQKHFISNNKIFSAIDKFGIKHNANTLRWAVVPYLSVISKFNL